MSYGYWIKNYEFWAWYAQCFITFCKSSLLTLCLNDLQHYATFFQICLVLLACM
uniref:Uncharacterized protein n=1 Tax=Anguilla anguilla TaxID=7936 RepID=A0A0E9VFT7_ANGAN